MIALAVRLVARGHHETLDRSRLPASRLKHVVRPADVGFERQEWSVEADPDQRLRTEVEHHRGATFGDGTLHIRERFELTFRDGDTPDVAAPEQLGAAVVVTQEDGDVRPEREKSRNKVRPD